MFYHKDVTFTLTFIFRLQYLEFEPIFSRIQHMYVLDTCLLAVINIWLDLGYPFKNFKTE